MSLHGDTYERRLIWRHRIGQGFEWLCRLATFGALGMLVVLLVFILVTSFTPGRGEGTTTVTYKSASGAQDTASTVVYSVSNPIGGQFEFKDEPGEKIKQFTEADLRDGKVTFAHDGRRSSPIFDLVVVTSGTAAEPLKKIGPANFPSDLSGPDVHLPPPAKPWGWLTWSFLTSYNSDEPTDAGILAGLCGSIWLVVLTGLMAVPLGVGAAIYLEEYAKPTRLTKLIQLNIANLAGVPSIVYGILGFTVFVRMFGTFDGSETVLSIGMLWFDSIDIKLPFGPVLLSGACTLALLSLPVVIISSQEALRSVPGSLRHAAYALGATKWQTIWHQVLPAALPGILTGLILSLSRAIGEAAPLAVIGVAAQLTFSPGHIEGLGDALQHPDKVVRAPFDQFTALPIQVNSWVNEAKPNFEHVAAAGILVLLATLLTMNATAIYIRQRFRQKIRW